MADLPPIPKMYLAQIEGRCSLRYASEPEDRKQWLQEWVDPKQDGNPYTHTKPILRQDRKPDPHSKLALRQDTSIYCLEIKFNGRVVSNGGQDTILRPVLGKNGIPYIPGSSIKGLFRRACNHEQKIRYCGDADRPGKLRFHGAYPVGDWTRKKRQPAKQGEVPKSCYLIEDIVHPQQKRQVEAQDSPSAYALISFYEPTMIFEFSSAVRNSDEENIDWREVETILTTALRQGLGGKTSTGYGFASGYIPEYTIKDNPLYNQALHIELEGTGVSSKLLSGELEFRPNIFKAALRGHVSRLLAGVCNNKNRIEEATDDLFGSTNAPGKVEIYWEQPRKVTPNNTYHTKGILHILAPEAERQFVNLVMQFAYIMGGFGKTWRRVSHEKFYPSYLQQYGKFDIGCHWISSQSNFITINNRTDLGNFLNQLYESCQKYLAINSPIFVRDWREAWHSQRVTVYSEVFDNSQAIKLFHQEPFKITPAIGGRERPGEPRFVSSVWHRMLPIEGNKYLEIVTMFHGDRTLWRNQLQPFIQSLENAQLQLTWGTRPVFNT
ncbi:hypothetical protein CDG77_31350 [Nostoc sp. 'Peltigera membranacea cyanobiont' 213]|uniref:RAMP superfamily CRISPR-associated protein n=1 Tax=Nostoc sp. 'Peltigera membranacea cyanobiont' 213 TaxID=2014530 RepID=UPI000B9545D7|nr:RAMP superfamily CRISPR-associated protein [Nostoc sp. 'Peltigera membranacea cyanobiont' 213]OYD87086.1 hypothetical protein CDG77_31350 [Nostoc sp. 'Peltigera membranacea cyanobiont' 213]